MSLILAELNLKNISEITSANMCGINLKFFLFIFYYKRESVYFVQEYPMVLENVVFLLTSMI